MGFLCLLASRLPGQGTDTDTSKGGKTANGSTAPKNLSGRFVCLLIRSAIILLARASREIGQDFLQGIS